jgi:hypothetical protein
MLIGSGKVGRNDPCPCGSGKKFKRCHGIAGVAPLRPAQANGPWPGSDGQLQAIQEIQRFVAEPSSPLTRAEPVGFHNDKSYWLRLTLNTAGIEVKDGGLPVGDSEEVLVPLPVAFPWMILFPVVDHDRFVGHAHVLQGERLCIYLDPAQEWHPSFGISEYLNQLWRWLSDAASAKFDAAGALFHPVGGVLHRTAGCPTIVVRDRLDIGSHPYRKRWLRERSPWRLDLVQQEAEGDLEAPLIALSGPLSYGAGTTIADLCGNLDRVKRKSAKDFLQYLRDTAIRNPSGTPQYFLLAVPRPSPQDSEDMHLIAGRVPTDAADKLRSSGTKTKPLNALGKETPVEWSPISEERPARTTRRDTRRPVNAYYGKRIVLWGCGGLGSWIGEFLDRAGAREIVLSDPGDVMGGLLVRQNYEEGDIGDGKARSLRRRLLAINERVDVTVDDAGYLAAIASGNLPDCDLLIDATVNNAVGAAIKEVWPSTKNRPLVARVSTDRASSTLGLMTVSRPGSGADLDELDDEAGKMVQKDADLEPFGVFWEEPNPADELVPAPGCSVPTFHGSAADLAAISGVLISLLGQHLSTNTPGTHLVSLPHGPGASIPHCFVGTE